MKSGRTASAIRTELRRSTCDQSDFVGSRPGGVAQEAARCSAQAVLVAVLRPLAPRMLSADITFASGRVSRASRVHTVMRNSTRDKRGPVGLSSSHRKLPRSRAGVVSVAAKVRTEVRPARSRKACASEQLKKRRIPTHASASHARNICSRCTFATGSGQSGAHECHTDIRRACEGLPNFGVSLALKAKATRKVSVLRASLSARLHAAAHKSRPFECQQVARG